MCVVCGTRGVRYVARAACAALGVRAIPRTAYGLASLTYCTMTYHTYYGDHGDYCYYNDQTYCGGYSYARGAPRVLRLERE